MSNLQVLQSCMNVFFLFFFLGICTDDLRFIQNFDILSEISMFCVYRQIKIHGAFWAQNILTFERSHVFLKSCSRSTRNLMASVKANYTLHSKVQTMWRFDEHNDWANIGTYIY